MGRIHKQGQLWSEGLAAFGLMVLLDFCVVGKRLLISKKSSWTPVSSFADVSQKHAPISFAYASAASVGIC